MVGYVESPKPSIEKLLESIMSLGRWLDTVIALFIKAKILFRLNN